MGSHTHAHTHSITHVPHTCTSHCVFMAASVRVCMLAFAALFVCGCVWVATYGRLNQPRPTRLHTPVLHHSATCQGHTAHSYRQSLWWHMSSLLWRQKVTHIISLSHRVRWSRKATLDWSLMWIVINSDSVAYKITPTQTEHTDWNMIKKVNT